MKKILVIGTSGSGKTTLAKKLSKKLGIPHFQLDELQFMDHWEIKSDETFFDEISKAVSNKAWIIDGNYGRTHHLTWTEADTVIWIDLPFWLTIYQNFSRSLIRSITKKKVWEGIECRESLKQLFSKDSVTLWAIQTYESNRKRYTERINSENFKHLQFHHLRSRRQIKKFLSKY